MPGRPSFAVWWRSLRAYSFTATVIPVTCAFLLAGRAAVWALYAPMLLCALLLHAAVNLLNDYYDFTLGFDTGRAVGSSGLLTGGVVPPRYMLRRGRFYLACGAAAGLMLAAVRGPVLLLPGLAALAGAFFYSHRCGYKYKGLGEPLVFLLMGPLLFGSSYYVACGMLSARALLTSLPFGCLVSAILLANNIRDLDMDLAGGFRTLPARTGARAAQRLYAGLVAAAFLLPLPAIAADRLTPWSLLMLGALPPAAKTLRTVLQAAPPFASLERAPELTAKFYLIYGVLFAAGLAINTFS